MSTRTFIAGTVAATLAVTGLTFAGGGGAGAATLPNSQSVGRFLDGAVGSSPIQQIADIADARAVNPGSVSDQNPLNVKVLNALTLPLTGSLQFQELLGIRLGAVNQVAVAKSDGYSYGASGAVENSGGVSIGGNNQAFPANATIDLDGSSLGAGNAADAIGQAHLSIGAVAALAQTPAGAGLPGTTSYGIGSIELQAASPLVAQLLSTVAGTLSTIINTLKPLATALQLPADCPLVSGKLPALNILNGAITIDPATGGLTLSFDKLLDALNLNLNQLPPNSDLIDLVLGYLTSPDGLAAALATAVNGIGALLQQTILSCAPPSFATTVNTIFGQLATTLSTAVTQLVGNLHGTTSPLAPLGTVLKQLVDIGINVQPNGPAGPFHSSLKATPSQTTPVVPGQTIVRAIELHLVGDPLASIALANAAAGPSAPQTVVTTTATAPPKSALPTGVPAGYDKPSGTPALPLVLLAIGLLMAGGGATAWRFRGRHSA